ncbi:MAG: hypothetical protein JSV19_12670 [Phycisphaerales bacterium]|nr:MAG: hypothetical protein JSV19_12670 [Phycisphaerales bacterium]
MASGFQLVDGVSVTNLDGISEGYSVAQTDAGYFHFVANVSAERFQTVLMTLAALVNEPGHLIIEKGTHRDDEERLRKTEADPFHCDVFYLDNISFVRFRSIFDRYSRFFIHCGGTNFGFGSGEGTDEVFVDRYKIVVIYADDPQKYIEALETLRIPKRSELKTVWSNFTEATPGSTSVITVEGKTIHEVVEELKKEGLYFAERREQ